MINYQMKKNSLFITIILLSANLFGQTNVFPDSGSVGIGTHTPSSAFDLHIMGSNANLFLQNTDASKWSYIRFKGSGSYYWDLAQYGNNDYFEIRPQGASGNYRTIFKQNGNVGFGTVSPSARIHAVTLSSGSNDVNNAAIFESTGGNGIVTIRSKGSGNFAALYGSLGTDLVGAIDFRPTTGDLSFWTNELGGTGWSHRMTIQNSNGYVGIGTSNPQALLAVNGNIRAKEIKVETGWSDFVFHDDYKLPTLQEVEKHIEEKGHLKDIPSAKEVAENGIFLGEMDSKLLQKIEELTLYTIQQEKKIKKLQEENQELKSLSNRLSKIEKLLLEAKK